MKSGYTPSSQSQQSAETEKKKKKLFRMTHGSSNKVGSFKLYLDITRYRSGNLVLNGKVYPFPSFAHIALLGGIALFVTV